MKLDVIDRSILDMLSLNGRMSFSVIGRNVGLTPSGIKKRVEKLEESGVIKGYTTILDYKQIGKPITAIISITAEPESIFELIKRFKDMNFIHEIYRLSKNNHLQLKFRANNISEMRNMIDNTIIKTKGVHKIDTDIVMDVIKEKL